MNAVVAFVSFACVVTAHASVSCASASAYAYAAGSAPTTPEPSSSAHAFTCAGVGSTTFASALVLATR